MKTWILSLVVLAVLSSALGCGGGGPKLGIDEVEDAYYELSCAKLVACAKESFIAILIPDQAACIDFLSTTYADEPGSIDDIIAAVEAGTVIYDGKAAHKCLEEQAAQSCEQFGNQDPEICREVFTGTIADDGACELDAECVSSFCDTTEDCPGVCAPTVAEGQPCEIDAECAPGTRCVRGNCTAWTRALAVGEDCEPGDDDWCGDGLFCHEGLEECAEQVDIGETCEGAGGAECVFGAICAADVEGALSCVELVIEDTQGEICDNRRGILCDMHAGLSCRIDDFEALTGTCVPTPGVGETCFEAGQDMAVTQCSFYDQLYCDAPADYQTDGTCALLKQNGEPCTGDDCLGVCNLDGVCESDSDTVCQ